MRRKIEFVFAFLFCFALASVVHANNYAAANWPNMARTLLRFGSINMNDDIVLDEYAAITECDLYQSTHKDDFKWNTVRAAIRDSVRQNIATFPTNYAYDVELQLGHYDFTQKEYKLTDKTAIHNVNTFVLYQNEGNACGIFVKNIPSVFRVVLDSSVSFDALPLDPKDGQALLERMQANNNPDKIIYTRFNLRLTNIPSVHKVNLAGEDSALSTAHLSDRAIRINAHLDSIDFFEDKAMTKLVYTYQP